MSYTYFWQDTEKTALVKTDSSGNFTFIPANPENIDYAEFLNSGDTAGDHTSFNISFE